MRTYLTCLLLIGGAGLGGCSPGEDEPAIGQIEQELSIFLINNSKSQAIALLSAQLEDAFDNLPSGTQDCLDGEGINPHEYSYTITCADTVVKYLFSSGHKVHGENVGAGCYWDCKVQVPGTSWFYEDVHYLKKYLTPAQASGGC